MKYVLQCFRTVWLSEYFRIWLLEYQCGFRKGFSAQHCLITMIEKWRQSLDSGGQAAAVLTDLSKAFDCIDHESLIDKFNAYGFDNSSLTFLFIPFWKKAKNQNRLLFYLLGRDIIWCTPGFNLGTTFI